MPTIEKKATTKPVTIGQLLSRYFNCADPVQYADMLNGCWLKVLSNLDHEEGNHMTPAHIQRLSGFLLDFKLMADEGHATASEAVD